MCLHCKEYMCDERLAKNHGINEKHENFFDIHEEEFYCYVCNKHNKNKEVKEYKAIIVKKFQEIKLSE